MESTTPYFCLSDFIAPINSGVKDYIGMFTVTCMGADQLAEKFKSQMDDYNSIMTKALADRLAEVFFYIYVYKF